MLLEQTAKYSLVTSLIWYGCLILSIIIFVIYLKFFNAKNKGYKKTQVKLGREITRLEEVVQNVKKDKRVDSLRKGERVPYLLCICLFVSFSVFYTFSWGKFVFLGCCLLVLVYDLSKTQGKLKKRCDYFFSSFTF